MPPFKEAFFFDGRGSNYAWFNKYESMQRYASYFQGQGMIPLGFFTPLKIREISQLLGFLEA